MNGPSDTIPAPLPGVAVDVVEAIASDLANLEGIARGLGDGLHELVTRLRSQAASARKGGAPTT